MATVLLLLPSARGALGVGAHQRLKRGLARLDAAERFDLTLIDCPPGTMRLR
jgi:hypothetical protein